MRLISFLGTTDYSDTTYAFNEKTCRTRFVAHALASIEQPTEICLIATDEAWARHGATVTSVLEANGLPHATRIPVPTGGQADHLWEMFSRIVDVIRWADRPVLLDITFGFRMQPFFAAACVQYVQAVIPSPPSIRVVYGEYRKDEATSPIWELTPFLDVLSWSRSLMTFLQTGQGDAVAEPTERLARELSKEWANSGRQGTQPQLRRLSKALQDFSNDFTTIRAGSLLLGETGSAQRLSATIKATQDEVSKHLPAMALILDQVEAMIDPLKNNSRLSSPVGQQSLLALARLYVKMGRYSEAISILREGWITLDAPHVADCPGDSEFDNDARKQQEEAWRTHLGQQSDTVSEIRNDIQHAGFNKQPHDKTWFKRQLDTLLNAWEEAINRSEAAKNGLTNK